MLQVKVREGVGVKKGEVEMEEKVYPIPKELHTGRAAEVRNDLTVFSFLKIVSRSFSTFSIAFFVSVF